MKTVYRGHEIDVRRQKCLAGYDLLYFSIFRVNDGFECESSFTSGSDSVREMIRLLKDRVDTELAEDDPWMEKEGLGTWGKYYEDN